MNREVIPDPVRCVGKKANGERCTRLRAPKHTACSQHEAQGHPKADQVRACCTCRHPIDAHAEWCRCHPTWAERNPDPQSSLLGGAR